MAFISLVGRGNEKIFFFVFKGFLLQTLKLNMFVDKSTDIFRRRGVR